MEYLQMKDVLVLQITDSSSHTLYSKEDATKGKFAFTTEDYDMFEVCFESKSPMGESTEAVWCTSLLIQSWTVALMMLKHALSKIIK